MTNIFAAKHFHDEEAARAWFEAARWNGAPVCPFCGSLKHYVTKKPGRYRCGEKECRKDFTVTTRTVMERSHCKLTQWAMAFWLGASSKKGFSAHQLHRALGCQYNTAWFLHHRVREAMREGGLEVPLDGTGEVVEVDETYYGPVDHPRTHAVAGHPYKKKSGVINKRAIISPVHRGGKVRSFHVRRADGHEDRGQQHRA
jgi:transposase-like protein